MYFYSEIFCASTKNVDAYPKFFSEFFDTLKKTKKCFTPTGAAAPMSQNVAVERSPYHATITIISKQAIRCIKGLTSHAT